MAKPKRRDARVLALQALCQFDVQREDCEALLDQLLADRASFDEFGVESDCPPNLIAFARLLAEGAWRVREAIDKRLAAAEQGWPLTRMALVDRNVLRLGLFELLEQPDTPHQVIINEAIELARRFGDVDSPAFVNGVLDALARQVRPESFTVAESDGDASTGSDDEEKAGSV